MAVHSPRISGATALVAILAGSLPVGLWAAPVRRISLDSIIVGPDQVTLHLNAPVIAKVGLFLDPPRLVIDLPNTEFAAPFKKQDGSGALLKGVRSGQFKGGSAPITRVVLDLQEVVKHTISWDGTRLKIMLANSVLEYRGYLTDREGEPLSGTFLLTFRVLAHSQSKPVWEESQYVKAQRGVYRAMLRPRRASVPYKALATGGRIQVTTPPLSHWVARELPYVVQAGAFVEEERAHAVAALIRKEIQTVAVSKTLVKGIQYYQVQVGPYDWKNHAEKIAQKLARMGHVVMVRTLK